MTPSFNDKLRHAGRSYAADAAVPDEIPAEARAAIRRTIALRHTVRTVGLGLAAAAVLSAVGLGALRVASHLGDPAGLNGQAGQVDIVWSDSSIVTPYGDNPICGAPAPTPVTEASGLSLTVLEGQPGVLYDADIWGYDPNLPTRSSVNYADAGGVTDLLGRFWHYQYPVRSDFSAASESGSRLVFDPANGPVIEPGVFVEIRSMREVATKAHVSRVGSIIVQGGVIVGYTDARRVGFFVDLHDGGSYMTFGDASDNGTHLCSGTGMTQGMLPMGDYQIYQAVHVIASREVSALSVLTFGQGAQWLNYPSSNAAHPVKTLTYPAGSYTEDLDVLLVSGPRDYSVLSPTYYGSLLDISYDQGDGTTFPDDPSCGATFEHPGPYPGTGIRLASPLSDLWPDGAPLDYVAWASPPEGQERGVATTTTPLDVWITRTYSVFSQTDPSVGIGEYSTILGHAKVVLGGGMPMALQTGASPTPVTATVSDLQWCPGVTPSNDGGDFTSVFVQGNVTWDNGSGPVLLWTSANVSIGIPNWIPQSPEPTP